MRSNAKGSVRLSAGKIFAKRFISSGPARLSKAFVPTAKEHITVGAAKSYELLLRAGFVRQSASGTYSLLPFGLRVLNKIERIIDEELQHCHKVSLPVLLSDAAWKRTGRWEKMGDEMFRLKDRNDNDMCLAPTHEEEITQLVANEVSSYRQLPLRLYQIGKKFRNELNPKMGLLRAREFVMKDLYTFDTNEKGAMDTYDDVGRAYHRIFTRLGVPFAVAEADTGAIGGSRSHEYHFVSPVGEDKLLVCNSCGYTANEERATSHHIPAPDASHHPATTLDSLFRKLIYDRFPPAVAPDSSFVVHLAYLGNDPSDLIAVLHHPKTQINHINVSKEDTVGGLDLTPLEDVSALLSVPPPKRLLILVDNALKQPGTSPQRDSITESQYQEFTRFLEPAFSTNQVKILHGDYRLTQPGDACPSCHSAPPTTTTTSTPLHRLQMSRAIEVAHTFVLGTKYSLPLSATFTEAETENIPIQMGCYGIGVSRLISAIAECTHDQKGLVWPPSVAPYTVCVIPVPNKKAEAEKQIEKGVEEVVEVLKGCVGLEEVVVDDRKDRQLGYRLKDCELIGYPFILMVGKSWVKEGKVEVECRRTGSKWFVTPNELEEVFKGVTEKLLG